MMNTPMRRQECCNCLVRFSITEAFYQQRLEDGEVFYCPNGHGQAFTETLASQNTHLLGQLKEFQRIARERGAELEALARQLPKRDAKGQFCGRGNDGETRIDGLA